MKLLMVSDEESKYIWEHFDPKVFSGIEMVISCGDLKSSYLDFIATMIPAPLYYVPGNHDKRFIHNPPEGCLSLDETVVVYKGIRIGGLGGCLGSNPNEPFEYTEREMCKKAARLEKKIKKYGGMDVFVTHAPPLNMGDGNDSFHKGFDVFIRLLDKYKPILHVFGHMHKRYAPTQTPPGKYNNTRLINSCGYVIAEIKPMSST